MATKHTHQVVFVKRVDGCPRCEELKAGAEPVKWNYKGYDAQRLAEIRNHDCRVSKCGVVCTHGDY